MLSRFFGTKNAKTNSTATAQAPAQAQAQAQAVTLKYLTTYLGHLLEEEACIRDPPQTSNPLFGINSTLFNNSTNQSKQSNQSKNVVNPNNISIQAGGVSKTCDKYQLYSEIPYNGKQGTIPNGMALLGRYEAVLTQTAYMSRLIYDPNPVMAAGVQFIDELPTVVNSALTLLNQNRASLPTTLQKVNPTIGNAVYINDPQHDTPCYIQAVDYRAQTSACPHPGKKVVYITFRGTNSLKTTFTDLKLYSANMEQLLGVVTMGGQTGTSVFEGEIAATPGRSVLTAGQSNPFGAHSGFVNNLMNVMPQLCKILETEFLADGSVDRIIVNGHSLGGANASLCALILAGFKRAGLGGLAKPTLHCITYGAPKCLMSYTRQVFNSFLTDGTMTYDRVANRMKNSLQFASQASAASTVAGAFFLTPGMNIIPTIPPNFEHPGFSILNTEIQTQSKTGRSKNISDIREMFGGLKTSTGWFKNMLNIGFNELPTYAEFMSCFAPTFKTEAAYAKSLDNRFGTIYSGTSDFKEEYAAILAKYQKITGTVPVQVTVEQAEAEQKQAEEAAKANTASIEQAPLEPEAPEPNTKTGGALTVAMNQASRDYKQKTLEVGPNHVVYSCKQKISFGFCHTGYMGISFNGMMKTVLVKKPSYAQMVATPTNTTYSEQEAPVGGKRKHKTKKAQKKAKKAKTMNKKRR